MKFYKLIIFILIVFLKLKLFFQNNLFNVNNIQIEKKDKITNILLQIKQLKKVLIN